MNQTRANFRRAGATTALVGVVAVVLAVVGVSAGDRADRSHDRSTAREFVATLQKFDDDQATSVLELLRRKKVTAEQVSKAVSRVVDDIPALPEFTGSGPVPVEVERARSLRADVVGRWQQADEELRREIVPASKLVEAGRRLVTIDPAKLLAGDYYLTSDDLKTAVLPVVKKRTKAIEKLAPTSFDPLLQADLIAYGKFFEKHTQDGIKKLSEGSGFFFELGSRPDDLYLRIGDVSAAMNRRLITTITTLTGGQATG